MIPKRTKQSWEDLWETLAYIEANRGRIGSWQINKAGTWDGNEREIVVHVRLFEIDCNE